MAYGVINGKFVLRALPDTLLVGDNIITELAHYVIKSRAYHVANPKLIFSLELIEKYT